MGGVQLGQKGGMIRISKRVVFIAAAVFALVLLAAVAAQRCAEAPDTPAGSIVPRQILPEETLIKGCLFDLGVIREDVSTDKRVVTVYTRKTLSGHRSETCSPRSGRLRTSK